MKEAIGREGGPFTLFGGEPLLLPMRDLEDLWSWGYETYGRNTVQTNGTLLTDAHIELFDKYNVRVGISVDGPGELNDVRWHGSLEKTRESTDKTHTAITKLCNHGKPPSLIVTVHRGNCSEGRLLRLLDWIQGLSQQGVKAIRIHLLESEDEVIRQHYSLTESENIDVLKQLLTLSRRHPTMTFDLFPEMQRLLLGDDRITTCIWYGCDVYTTKAVRGIEGQGQSSNCGRTNKDGVDFIKAGSAGYERYIALYNTPQSLDGCKGCRFFLMCKGQCPGTAIGGDWRNRSEHCGVWKELFRVLEAELVSEGLAPLSLSKELSEIEELAISHWESGKEVSMNRILEGRGGDLANYPRRAV